MGKITYRRWNLQDLPTNKKWELTGSGNKEGEAHRSLGKF